MQEIEPSLIAFAQKLVQTKSITCQEGELASLVREKMLELDYDQVEVDEFGNVLGKVGSGPIKIMFDSHMDTVQEGDRQSWTHCPFGGEIVDGKLYGRGSADMKSALAASVYAGYCLKKLDLLQGKTVIISASVMEENYDGEALNQICHRPENLPNYVVICEPSGLNVALGHQGRALIKINTTGVSAHGSAPERGVNAIYKMCPIIEKVEKLSQSLSKQKNHGSAALTKIESQAVSLNAIPTRCTAYLDRRLSLKDNLEFINKEMEELVADSDATWEIHEEHGMTYTGKDLVLHSFLPAWELSKDHPLVQTGVRACEDIMGKPVRTFLWNFCTNGVATAGKMSIPTIGLGPGNDALAHMVDEHCPTQEIVNACGIYTAMAAKL